MKKLTKFLTIVVFCAGFLSAQLSGGFLDTEILDVALGEGLIVLGSKSGVNWKRADAAEWQSVKHIPLWADSGYIFDNIVAGEAGRFAVRLRIRNNEVSFFQRGFNTPVSQKISKDTLFGWDGFFCKKDEDNRKYYFAIGEGGVAVLDNGNLKILEAPFNVVSVSNTFAPYDFIALSSGGVVFRSKGVAGEPSFGFLELDTLKLGANEEVIRFFNDFTDSSILILAIDTATKKETLYRWNERSFTAIYRGDILKAISTSRPNKYIYILTGDGTLLVLNENGTPNETRRRFIADNLIKTNIAQNYTLTDIAVFGNDLAISSDRGVFYSEDGGANFQFFPQSVPIRSGLREVYAEPGIISNRDRFATFEYSLSEGDHITIDIFNYNMDFVCRIVENGWREAGEVGRNSTNRQIDKWDGTINNSGGRTAAPGVYYFKITTLKGKSAIGKVVVAK